MHYVTAFTVAVVMVALSPHVARADGRSCSCERTAQVRSESRPAAVRAAPARVVLMATGGVTLGGAYAAGIAAGFATMGVYGAFNLAPILGPIATGSLLLHLGVSASGVPDAPVEWRSNLWYGGATIAAGVAQAAGLAMLLAGARQDGRASEAGEARRARGTRWMVAPFAAGSAAGVSVTAVHF